MSKKEVYAVCVKCLQRTRVAFELEAGIIASSVECDYCEHMIKFRFE